MCVCQCFYKLLAHVLFFDNVFRFLLYNAFFLLGEVYLYHKLLTKYDRKHIIKIVKRRDLL